MLKKIARYLMVVKRQNVRAAANSHAIESKGDLLIE